MENINNQEVKKEKKPWSLTKAFFMGFFVFSIPLYIILLKHHFSGLFLAPIIGAELTFAITYFITKKKENAKSDTVWSRSILLDLVMTFLMVLNLKLNWDESTMGGQTIGLATALLCIHIYVCNKVWKSKESNEKTAAC